MKDNSDEPKSEEYDEKLFYVYVLFTMTFVVFAADSAVKKIRLRLGMKSGPSMYLALLFCA